MTATDESSVNGLPAAAGFAQAVAAVTIESAIAGLARAQHTGAAADAERAEVVTTHPKSIPVAPEAAAAPVGAQGVRAGRTGPGPEGEAELQTSSAEADGQALGAAAPPAEDGHR